MKTITVCDIGARGSFHPRWKEIAGRLHAVSIEADPDANIVAPECREFTLFKQALWNGEKTVTLNLTRKLECSSVFEPNRRLIDRFPDCERFDVLWRQKLQAKPFYHLGIQPNFLKVDTQGAEYAILISLNAWNLQTLCGVEVEVSFAPIYEGAPLFGEVDYYLRKQGFELWDINRYYWRDLNDGGMRCTMGDALYFKQPSLVHDPEIAKTLQDCYRVTLRQRAAHAFQWATKSADAQYEADMQLGR